MLHASTCFDMKRVLGGKDGHVLCAARACLPGLCSLHISAWRLAGCSLRGGNQLPVLCARVFPCVPCRSAKDDYIYAQELQAYEKSGVLTQLHVAFSRDGPSKVGGAARRWEAQVQEWREPPVDATLRVEVAGWAVASQAGLRRVCAIEGARAAS